MMMMDGCDYKVSNSHGGDEARDADCMEWRVRALSARMLRGGWSTEDVVESLGSADDLHFHHNVVALDGDSCFDFRHAPKL